MSDKMKNIKEGISGAAEKLKHMPGDAASAAGGKLKDISNTVSAATSEKLRQWVREFNEAVPTMKALGFSVRNFSVGVGLVPELDATLVGSVNSLDIEKISEWKQRSHNKLLSMILGGLITAAELKNELTGFGIKGIEIRIKLGLPPLVSVNLLA